MQSSFGDVWVRVTKATDVPGGLSDLAGAGAPVIQIVIPAACFLDVRLNAWRNVVASGIADLLESAVRIFHVIVAIAFLHADRQLSRIELQRRAADGQGLKA